MRFDPLVANAGRLCILTALAAQPRQEFVALRQRSGLSDGNLSCHARRLASAGLVSIAKRFRAGRPVTELELTLAGRQALEEHARAILNVTSGAASPLADELADPPAADADSREPLLATVGPADADEDEPWID